jgi:RNA recognition motif-containing protein
MVLMGSREDGMRAIGKSPLCHPEAVLSRLTLIGAPRLTYIFAEMFHGYNWQTRILEVRPERLPPEYEQHATPMQQSMPRPGSSPAMLYQQQQQQQHGLHGVANMLLNHAHSASQQNGFNMGSGGMRSASPYKGAGVGRPPFPHGSSPMQAHQIASPTPLQSNLLGATAASTPSPVPSSASPSLSAALLNHNQQQQIARALTPKATSVQPSSLAQHQADMRNLEIGLAGSLRLGSSPQLPSATTVGSRAPPPGSLGSLPPPPAFAGMSHAQQPAYAQIRQADGRASSRSQDSLAGRVLFVGNLPFHVQWQDLKDLFRSAGNIQRANVALGGDGRSRGFGSVQYSSKDDAEIAIGLFDGCVPSRGRAYQPTVLTPRLPCHSYELNGRKLQVHHESAEISRPGPQATQAPYGQQPVHLQQQQQLTFQQQQQPFQHQQQQQQHARQQLGQLSMSFSRLPAFGHDASYYVPPSPFHAPTSPYLPPQSPAGYGPPSSFPYFPATFATGSTFGSSYSGAQMASTTLSSTAEEPSRAGDANPSSNRASAPMPSPIGPPRGHPPGRIALPPAYPFNNGPSSAGSAMSPMHGRGLPMLTPSMPSFQFHNGFPVRPPRLQASPPRSARLTSRLGACSKRRRCSRSSSLRAWGRCRRRSTHRHSSTRT